ncbi:peptidyl-prolyl cis-trans isomerase [Ramlibacter sp. RBP-2]|uniref:Periplasmic chaperone PpiD n=1 Tax=Ramlibacter lithotrophicus TaxID=2606681 RepID=A0A7X6DDC7_9BURK|nr:SurA N-terminal domain-containing protein [Ramlibacter lithotrophicus]NKE65112.1 peptidyl-prolyl cis-trans isomerase [Ramlibacter lithotrophicus]
MFDFVRKHTRIMQLILFLLIFPSFVLFGLEGYNRFREKGDAVAKVDGREILQGDWDAAHKQEVERLRQQLPNLDSKMLESPAAKYATLERMVRDRVLAAAAAQSKLVTSDQRLARELQRNEMIAALRGPDGKLDMARYRQLVGAQGMTPEMFEAGVRAELSANQVLLGVGGTTLVTPAQVQLALDAFLQQREVQLARFSPADYASQVKPADAELEAFYKENQALFQAPEQAAIEYVVLDVESVRKGLTVNEQDLKTYYEQNVARLGGQEERRASHILIAVPKGAPDAEKQKARAKAQELLAQVKKAPDSFAELAKKHSQDPGSAAQGGDLDFFARGAMTKPFEDAAFALGKGEISGIVETDFGYHIVKVTDVKVPKQRNFEQMKPELEAEVAKQLAQRKYAEAADTFTNTVYEQSDSLKPAADKLKLQVRTATVTRQPAPGATGPLANPKFLGALFAPDNLEKKRNTEAVEVAPSTLASGRVVQHTPARTLPFAEVRDRVRERLVAARSAELARKDGAARLAAWKAALASASLPPPVVLSRVETRNQPLPVIEAVLRVDPAALPGWAGIDLGNDGYVVAKVNKVIPRPAPAPQMAQQERQEYAQAWATAENLAYYNMLKDRFKAQILVPKPADEPEPKQ